jgi:hypothetical protein
VIQDGRHFESWKTKGVEGVEQKDRLYIPVVTSANSHGTVMG